MRKQVNIFGFFILLIAILPVHAAKERLVLMPLRVSDEDRSLQGAMETAVVKGLQQKYEVFSGEQVSKKAREIFSKESRNTSNKECDETRCMQGIAEAFQAELIATTNVTKRAGGYFLALSIQNIFDNKVVYSESLPCEGCSEFQVIEKLKELAGTPVASAATTVTQAATSNDADAALWNEVIKGNSIEDYKAYLLTYPSGKYSKLANTQIKKLEAEARASAAAATKQQADELARQEKAVWDQANRDGTVESYSSYLQNYPQGQFVVLAQARINKLKNSSVIPVYSGKTSRACATCPEMVSIPAGSFQMGSTQSSDEMPVHTVKLKAFKLTKTEITQEQWKAVMGANPSTFDNCANCPVEGVSWEDALAFIKILNEKTGLIFRLPTEAEWEYACRAGAQTDYCGSSNLDEVAWHINNSNSKPNPVAQKKANAFGLYDMSGNVMEWVQDCYSADYSKTPVDGSAAQSDNCKQVLRGGSWGNGSDKLRATYRHTLNAFFRKYIYMGLRLAQD